MMSRRPRTACVSGLWLAAAVLGALASCATPPPAGPAHFEPVGFGALPGWAEDRLDGVLPGLLADCERVTTLPADQTLGGGSAGVGPLRAATWLKPCRELAALSPEDRAGLRRVIERDFRPYRLSAEALLTGYYEPELSGSLTPSPDFPTPLLRRPADLATGPDGHGFGRMEGGKLLPFPARRDIDAGALDDQRLAFLYLATPIDRFLLQIQGSGRIRLADGQLVRVGYDGQNGQPYVPIGRLMVERGLLPKDGVSLQSIRAWLVAHPAEAGKLMAENPPFVFFKSIPDLGAEQGPRGTLGTPLRPLRSAAVDSAAIPLGTPLFIDAIDPDGHKLQRLVLAQDTGSGINGAARADLFFGWGAEAERQAGRMDRQGVIFALLPADP